jgi:hypothetical protein
MKIEKFALAAVAVACAAGAHAAPRQTLSYTADPSFNVAWIVDWNAAKHTAHLVDYVGAADGTWTDDGTLRVLTLSAPLETTQDTFDCNGLPMTQTVDLLQVAVRHVSGGAHKGSAQLVEIGTTTDQGGCTPGLVTPYGSTSDAGTATTYLDMAERPDTDDLRHGATLAGMSDTDPAGGVDSTQLVARTVTFAHRAVTFANSGASVPRDVVDGWFVLDFGGFQRGYTRLSVDPKTHAEQWLGAAWRDGAPQSIFQTMMVQPNAAAGFGGHNAQSHVWNSGLFLQSDTFAIVHLFPDFTGIFEQQARDGSFDSLMPATWTASGADLVISRSSNFAVSYRTRTWVPIANYGKAHFVIENEDNHVVADGSVTPFIVPRVNFYVDEGKAVPPAATPALKALARKAAVAAPARTAQP